MSEPDAGAYVLPDGGEVHFTTDREPAPADRIEILPGGWVKLVFKHSYKKEILPSRVIEGIHSHTQHEEDQGWW